MRCFSCGRTGFSAKELEAHQALFKHPAANPNEPHWHESSAEVTATPMPGAKLTRAELIALISQLTPEERKTLGLGGES
jgi:hypothetical protein